MARTVGDSRRKYLKYLIQASAAVLVSPWATPTYAEEVEDDEEEEPVVEKPKPKVLTSLVQVHRPAMLCRKGACKMNEYSQCSPAPFSCETDMNKHDTRPCNFLWIEEEGQQG